MAKYSRNVNGRAVDVVSAASAAAAAAIFGPTLFSGGDFLLVPNETQPGAKLTIVDDAVTAIENPPAPPAPPTVYRLLTPNQVIDLMLATLGAAGFAACVRSDIDAMVTWRYKMSVARDISKTQAAGGLSIIVASGLMTAGQRTAILDSWPAA